MRYNLKLQSKKDSGGRYLIDSVYMGTKTDPKDILLYSGNVPLGPYSKFIGQDMSAWVWSGSNIIAAFDSDLAKADLCRVFEPKLIQFSPYWSILSDMIEFKNFVGIKNYMGGLLQMGILGQEEYDAFIKVFANQNIIL